VFLFAKIRIFYRILVLFVAVKSWLKRYHGISYLYKCIIFYAFYTFRISAKVRYSNCRVFVTMNAVVQHGQ